MERDERTGGEWDAATGRGGGAALVAAVAVAAAIFILGGYVRAYRQLEALRTEYKRKADELENLKRQHSRSRVAAARRQPDFSVPDLPPARRAGDSLRPPAAPRIADLPSHSAAAWDRRLPDVAGPDAPAAPRIEGERSAAGERPPVAGVHPPDTGRQAPARDRRRVIAVSQEKNTLIIEGGQNAGFAVGQTLELRRRGVRVAGIRVTGVFSAQSVCEILDQAVQPLPGDSVIESPGTVAGRPSGG